MRTWCEYFRNISPTINGSHPKVIARGGLEIKVCVRTYRFFYVSNTEDYMWRLTEQPEVKKAQQKLQARNILRRKWMDDMEAGSSNLKS